MVTVEEVQRLLLDGGEVVGPDGRTIGHVGQLFLDAASGEPAWVTVATGMFGRDESFVPLAGAAVHGTRVEVRWDKDDVKHAPRIDGADGTLSPAEEAELYRYYGILPAGTVADEAVADEAVADDVVPDVETRREYAGQRADGDTVVMAEPVPERAEQRAVEPHRAVDDHGGAISYAEHARVIGSERVPTERVRLRRYTVTEEREITIPVEREEYRVEYEPAEGGAARADSDTIELGADDRDEPGRPSTDRPGR